MRLTQIKLSGFKSFVDPTQLYLPGRLVGVVGPNGCGKSNIIDAARWVLGESRASELRGESMDDVIFSGTATRKAAGRASVEFVFDNAPEANGHRVGGPWGQYSEIAVKRVLTRDGTSSYLINNQPVRRRDIQDIFSGTGLGPRAYAIVGQGMISRIIEARPEELRIFLEEAAGISKYKERRRETENRLADTRENLTRVEDILRELGANLERLEGQAVVAERYRALEVDAARKQQLLWTLRAREADALASRHRGDAEAARVALDARVADLRHVEASLVRSRNDHQAAGDRVHAAQGRYYDAAAAVSGKESEIRVVVEARNRLHAQLGQLAAQRDHWAAEVERLKTAGTDAVTRLADIAEAIRGADAALEAETAGLPAAEAEAGAADAAVAALRTEVAAVERDLALESTHQRNAARNLDQIAERRARLDDERRRLAPPDAERLAAVERDVAGSTGAVDAKREALEAAEAALPGLQSARSEAHATLDRESGEHARIDARLAALKDLQERVQTEGKLQPWLERHDLGRLPRLWQRLRVEAGWETAVEAVLRERVGALEVSRLDRVRAFLDDAPPAKLAFFAEHPDAGVADAVPRDPSLSPLLDKVTLRDPSLRAALTEWMHDVYVATDETDALARRSTLPAGATFAVPSGHQIGRDHLLLHAADAEQAGVLVRQHEIDDLARNARAQALLADEARDRAVRDDVAVTRATAALVELRQALASGTADLHARQMTLEGMRRDAVEIRDRDARIGDDLARLAAEDAAESDARRRAEARFEELDATLEDAQGRLEDASTVAEAARGRTADVRARVAACERAVQDARYEERSATERIADIGRQGDVAAGQRARAVADEEKAAAELAALTDEAAQAGLQDAVAARVVAETALGDARAELDALSARVRGDDESRIAIERDLDPLRTRISDAQLKEQAARTTFEQIDAHLVDAAVDRAALDAFLAGDEGRRLRVGPLVAEVQQLQQAIADLGAVNLAALGELGTARERKTFLDAQSADLGEAISTLEDAIRRIDRETRTLLQETFDAINAHLGRLFSVLFDGGDAHLVMTGDEILDAGVRVMAQPPGKTPRSIQLLSGGEKALTAFALVFAMFELNPAPFCLLDEVDAALDDANTERFCALVRTMAANTQFLFISHNKIAMEMAEQLIGVTMQEKGVSRIVAVDLEAAVTLTADRNEEAVAPAVLA